MNISRSWAMPDKDTFNIKPIHSLISSIIEDVKSNNSSGIIIDPFSNGDKNKFSDFSNDIDPSVEATYHIDALDFLGVFGNESVDVVLFDPPYSPRQVSECYKKFDRTVNMQTTQSSFWRKLKEEISRVVKPSGIVVVCGWNSGGVGMKYGFDIIEILMVAHGGWHNDTIVTVCKKESGENHR